MEDQLTLDGQSHKPGQWRTFLSWVVLIAVITLAIWYLRSHWQEYRQLPPLTWWYYPIIALLIVSIYLIPGFITNLLARFFGVKLRTIEWIALSFITALGNLVPARVGTILRGMYLKRQGLPYSHYASTLTSILLLAMLAQLIVGGVGLVLLVSDELAPPPTLLVLVGGGFAMLATLAVWAPASPRWLGNRLRPVAVFLEGWREIHSNRKLILTVLLCSLLNACCSLAMLWILLHQLTGDVSVAEVAVIQGLSGIMAVIAITPGAVGFLDLPVVALSSMLGIDHPVTVKALLIIRMTEAVVTVVLGTLSTGYLFKKGAKPAKI